MEKILATILKPITTATMTGSSTRYIIVIISTVLTTASLFGILTEEQVKELTAKLPEAVGAVTAAIGVATALYGILTKSNSDKAQLAANLIDKEIPKSEPVVIKTPGAEPDIVITHKDAK